MGRSTHNRKTRSRVTPAEINKEILTPISLEGLPILENIEDVKAQTVIPHSDASVPSEELQKICDTLTDFSILIQGVMKRFEDNEIFIKEQEQITTDMLHDFELSPPKDMYRAYKCYVTLRNVRQARRKAKLENKMLAPIYNYVKANPVLPRDMKALRERCVGIQHDIEHAQYQFRSDLKVD